MKLNGQIQPAPVSGLRIVHHLPGRTRFEASPALAPRARARLEDCRQAAGWRRARFNPATRTLLIEHSPDRPPEAVAEALLTALEAEIPIAGAVATPPAHEAAASDPDLDDWMSAEAGGVFALLSTVPAGLEPAEAVRRIARDGANALDGFKRRPRSAILGRQLATLPVALLAGSAVLSLATGGVFDAVVTLGVVALNASIGFSTENGVEALIARLSAPIDNQAVVLRGGEPCAVSSREVVQGDLIVLTPGQVVAADARLIEASDLTVDESILTGESLGVDKHAEPIRHGRVRLPERSNMVHGGTVVLGGQGVAVVVRTGARTEAAAVRSLIASARPPKPVIEEKLDELSRTLVLGALAGSGLVLGVGLVRRHPLVQTLRSAVSLAVASLPEGLPAVATTTFALEAKAMERRGVYVRALPAIESLGAIDTLCLDKTGTLTENRMSVAGAAAGSGVYTADAGERLLREDGDPAEEKDHRALVALAEAVALCNEARVGADGVVVGSGTELALLEFARLVGIATSELRAAAPVISVRQRSPARRYMSTFHRRDGESLLFLKGAPEDVLALCSAERRTRGHTCLDPERRVEILAQNDRLAARGERVLGVARRRSRTGEFDPEQLDDLEWLGLVGLSDPLRPRARQAVEAFQAAGIRTLMITGDQPATARAVADMLGLAGGGPTLVLTGADIAAMDAETLAVAARRTTVFARATPADKLRIVRALQTDGAVVGVLGDGVNDGPALREARVGVAMGRRGSDLAREVADVVIADDDLSALAGAVARGRSTDDNIKNAIRFLLATNLSEILVMLVEAFGSPLEQETPVELFWLNLVTDVLPALGLALAEPAGDVMRRPPVGLEGAILGREELRTLAFDAAQIGAAALVAHFASLARQGAGPGTRAATFLTLAGAQLVHAFSLRDRSNDDPRARAVSLGRLELFVAASAGLLVLPFAIPGLGAAMGVGRVGVAQLGGAAALAGGSLMLSELRRGGFALPGPPPRPMGGH